MNLVDVSKTFSGYYKSLHELSLDDANNVYMTDSYIQAISFDDYKKKYCSNLNTAYPDLLQSVDAITFSPDFQELYFIEFKDGRINSKNKQEITLKAISSILMLGECFPEIDLPYLRENAYFILVFNDEKNPPHHITPSKSLNDIYSSVYKLANEQPVCRFETIDGYRGILFKESYSYTEQQFKEFVNSKSLADLQLV